RAIHLPLKGRECRRRAWIANPLMPEGEMHSIVPSHFPLSTMPLLDRRQSSRLDARLQSLALASALCDMRFDIGGSQPQFLRLAAAPRAQHDDAALTDGLGSDEFLVLFQFHQDHA